MNALFSVLMPSYRDIRLVERSLPRILEGSRCDLEVVVLNNDSSQVETVRDLVRAIADPRVRVLDLEHRAGFSRAINAGIEATRGELVFFANSDLFVADGYLDEMGRFFERHPRAACAAGKILRYELDTGRETDIIDTTGHTIGRNRRVVDRGENERDVGQYEREEQVFGVSGAAIGSTAGTGMLLLDRMSWAHSLLEVERPAGQQPVSIVTLEQALAELPEGGSRTIVKIDAEGSECDILARPGPLERVDVLMVEWHPALALCTTEELIGTVGSGGL